MQHFFSVECRSVMLSRRVAEAKQLAVTCPEQRFFVVVLLSMTKPGKCCLKMKTGN